MSETRPPITAGPIERAFRFLKSTSVSCGGVGEEVGVADDDKKAVAVGESVGDVPAVGSRPGGVSSCPGKLEISQIQASKAQKETDRLVIGSRI